MLDGYSASHEHLRVHLPWNAKPPPPRNRALFYKGLQVLTTILHLIMSFYRAISGHQGWWVGGGVGDGETQGPHHNRSMWHPRGFELARFGHRLPGEAVRPQASQDLATSFQASNPLNFERKSLVGILKKVLNKIVTNMVHWKSKGGVYIKSLRLNSAHFITIISALWAKFACNFFAGPRVPEQTPARNGRLSPVGVWRVGWLWWLSSIHFQDNDHIDRHRKG